MASFKLAPWAILLLWVVCFMPGAVALSAVEEKSLGAEVLDSQTTINETSQPLPAGKTEVPITPATSGPVSDLSPREEKESAVNTTQPTANASVPEGARFAAARLPAARTLVFNGNTDVGVVFVRPDNGGASGVPPPTTLSSFANEVRYEAVHFRVTRAGVYTIKSTSVMPSGWDNFGLLYRGSFAPSTPLVNLIASNDDGPGGVGASQVSLFLSVGVYVFVTTGFNNDGVGTYKIFSGGPAKLQLLTYVYEISTVGGNTFPRVTGLTRSSVSTSTVVPFNSFAFKVSTTGTYEILSSATDPKDYDHISLVYKRPVNPKTPLNGLIAQNDDFGSTRNSFVRVRLQAGTVYYIATTSFNADANGIVKYSVSGPGTVTALPGRISFRQKTSLSKVWNRVDASGLSISTLATATGYLAVKIRVSSSGIYTFKQTARNYDNFLVLYQTSFNPFSQQTNFKIANDDNPDTRNSGFTTGLDVGVTYVLVSTGFSNSAFGSSTTTITGPGGSITKSAFP
eukprot:TRINITY_DN6228_c0_g1_i1.p1 TRINITY_DN6228_c0_g1~~TRINITY_DN6228_c0_g1_i1.p1  ORF type:complete len:538 (-),score=62.27 TRINITY_DN6228_c0_g1_i1:707-2242(-)